MSIDRLLQVLSAIHPLPSDCRELLKRELKPVSLPKGHYLAQAQSAAHSAYFLQQGFCVAYQYQRNKRIVTEFWQSGDIILSPRSFFEQLATDEIVQLTTDSRLWSISYSSASRLFEKSLIANLIARNLTAAYYDRIEQRIVDVHTLDAWDRYQKLIMTYPGIELNVSQDLIASYLGITPQSLSRLKAARS